MDKKDLLTYYRAQAVDKERMYAKPFRRYQQNRRLEVIRALAVRDWDRHRHEQLLDVGCGDGYGTSVILQGLDVTLLVGLDLSLPKLRASGRILSTSRMILGDAERLPLANDTFDIVLSLETLEHLMDPQLSLQEITRVLRPGGTFLLSIPVSSCLNASMAKKLMRLRRRNKFHEHIQFYTYKQMARMLTDAGLQPRWRRFCVFNFPCFELYIRIIPYRIWRALDNLFSLLPFGFVGWKYGLSFGVGSEYLVVAARKDLVSVHP